MFLAEPTADISAQAATVLSEFQAESQKEQINIDIFKTLSKKQASALKSAAKLTDEDFLRHINNWSLPSKKRESSLRYPSFKKFYATFHPNPSFPPPAILPGVENKRRRQTFCCSVACIF